MTPRQPSATVSRRLSDVSASTSGVPASRAHPTRCATHRQASRPPSVSVGAATAAGSRDRAAPPALPVVPVVPALAAVPALPAVPMLPVVPAVDPELRQQLLSAGLDPTAASAQRYALEKRSTILMVGLSVHRTPVELRERLSVPEAEVPRVVEELCAYPHILEAGVLSTCNRMEIYVVARSFHPAVREVQDWMCRASGLPLADLRSALFVARAEEATQHLMQVASGLDSLVMGEGQILAQVRQLHLAGQGVKGFGRVLSALFKASVTVGKRVRSETAISEGAVSVSSAAVELAALKLRQAELPPLAEQDVVLVGAGKMGRLVVKHLASKGVTSITVINRSKARAVALAEEFPEVRMDIRPASDLKAAVEGADVVVTASGASEILVHSEEVEAMAVRRRMFIDIAVPRNVDPLIGQQSAASSVYNVDDLREVVEANKASRAAAARAAEVIIQAEVEAFGKWKQTLDSVPKIRSLRHKADTIKLTQLQRYLQKLENRGEPLTDSQAALVEQLTHTVISKLLHDPISDMRELPEDIPVASNTGERDSTASHWLKHV